MTRLTFIRFTFLLIFLSCSVSFTVAAQDKFPVPLGNPKQLFYLQRTANTNTIICELNYNNNV